MNILLRYRDINIEDSVAEHNKIIKENKKALWGWWKKQQEPFPDPVLTELKDNLDLQAENGGNSTVFFINSGNRKIFQAPLYKIYYSPNEKATLPPIEELCPSYYRGNKCYAWFEIGEMAEVSSAALENFSISSKTPSYSKKGGSAVSSTRVGRPLDITNYSFLEDDITFWVLQKDKKPNATQPQHFESYDDRTYSTRGKYIVHLSDLHFGEKHAYNIPKAKNKSIGKESLIDALTKDLEEQKILPHEVALVLISGDLTCTASPHEFNEAERFIEELRRRFGLNAAQVVCVPGNHDIEWLSDSTNLNEDAELNYRNFSRNIYYALPAEILGRFNEFYIGKHKIAVVGLNSCRLESRENAGMGYVSSEQIRHVTEKLQGDRFNYIIALVHHHLLPVNYTEYYSTEKKAVSLLLDAEAVLQSLIKNKVNLVLHGHQHQPYFSKLYRYVPAGIAGDSDGISGEISIVGGGSAGADMASLNSIGRNTYQIVELVEGDEEALMAKITLRVRNASGSGYTTAWEKSI